MRAVDATRKPVVTIGVAATIEAAATMMHDARVGALVVTDADVPVGIVTDRDIVLRAVRRGIPTDARVDSVMTEDVVAFEADGDLHDAVSVLRAHSFRRLPLVRDGELVALLSTDDVLIDFARSVVDVVHPITGQVRYADRERNLSPVVSPA